MQTVNRKLIWAFCGVLAGVAVLLLSLGQLLFLIVPTVVCYLIGRLIISDRLRAWRSSRRLD